MRHRDTGGTNTAWQSGWKGRPRVEPCGQSKTGPNRDGIHGRVSRNSDADDEEAFAPTRLETRRTATVSSDSKAALQVIANLGRSRAANESCEEFTRWRIPKQSLVEARYEDCTSPELSQRCQRTRNSPTGCGERGTTGSSVLEPWLSRGVETRQPFCSRRRVGNDGSDISWEVRQIGVGVEH